MGSWSVSCGISNIAITSGNECVLLPLRENNENYGYGQSQAATLPIFGTYNDYGGMEDIEQDKNTELIAKHFGVSIEEFIEYLVDGEFTYNRDEAKDVAKKMNMIEGVGSMRFMWIDRKVYDYMIKYEDVYYKGYNNYGTPAFMKLFGFKLDKKTKIKEGDNRDIKRFNQRYRKGDVTFYSDGKILLSNDARNGFVYHFGRGDDSSIETYFDVPEELHYLKELGSHETWKLIGDREAKLKLGPVIGNQYAYDLLDILENTFKPTKLHQKYVHDLETFGDGLANLITLHHNLHPMSGELKPHVLYLTPQCGEFERHQQILDEFSKINKTHIRED